MRSRGNAGMMKRLIAAGLALLLCGVALAEETEMKYDFSIFTKNLCTQYLINSPVYPKRNRRISCIYLKKTFRRSNQKILCFSGTFQNFRYRFFFRQVI